MILSLALGLGGGYAAFRFTQPGLLTQPDVGTPPDTPTPELARLNEALGVALQDLEDARAEQAERAAEVEDFKAQVARQAADLDAMAEKLAAVSSEAQPSDDAAAALEALNRERDSLTAENEALRSTLATLEAERDALRQDAGVEQTRLSAELARLQNEVLPQLTADRDRLQRKSMFMLADQAKLNAQARAAQEAKAADTVRIYELETRLAEVERELTAALAAREAVQPPAGAEPEVTAQPPEPETPVTAAAPDSAVLAPRDPDAVAAALRSAPGIGSLTGAERQMLTERLIQGECVTTALEAVFNRVPILTLRNLIRDLNSDC
ncbi:MAG: hypothetical protein Q8S27_07200 [Hoeflea sp.]|nr:hypothetical protein [Hoeflea sp.]